MSTFRWFNKRKEANNVSDRMLPKAIYDQYYEEFCAYDKDSSLRASKIYVPIDRREIANQLNLDPDIVFGRLYYHWEENIDLQKQMEKQFLCLSFALPMTSTQSISHFCLQLSQTLSSHSLVLRCLLFSPALALLISVLSFLNIDFYLLI